MAALKRLQDKGLVNLLNRPTEKAIQVSLTDRGLVLGADPRVTESLNPATCQSFYIGPKSSEHQFHCDRKKNGHKGKHRYTAYGHLKKPLRWTDAEAGGLASTRYGDQLRQHEADRRVALEELIAELRPGADIEHYMAL
ncbi:hypothetical protein [Paenarthrobacter sp. C1]|uniref:hypothetical protein n=1 Tax=Paenarthrobacter sp. C1 TaxID=3400220 RepID=UPI003BF56EAA